MPSYDLYKKLYASTDGQEHKEESDMIMDYTWDEDYQSVTAYFYDYYHDSEPLKYMDMNSSNDSLKTPIKIKFLQNSLQTYAKDRITFHIQFKPSQECTVDYYDEFFATRYKAIFPIGLYVDIPDEKGKYNRWLVVDQANFYQEQFPTFEVLPCEKIIQYVMNGRKWQIAGVLRSQNSYNSGLWTDL